MNNIKQIIAEMRELEAKCSEGPWCPEASGVLIRYINKNCCDAYDWHCDKHVQEECKCFGRYDGDIIAFLRNNITAILDYVDELENTILKLQTRFTQIDGRAKGSEY